LHYNPFGNVLNLTLNKEIYDSFMLICFQSKCRSKRINVIRYLRMKKAAEETAEETLGFTETRRIKKLWVTKK
jgi:hypothetical protein